MYRGTQQKIMVGMMRPEWNTFFSGTPGYIYCTGCGRILQTIEETRDHWQSGHFDYPVYGEACKSRGV